MERVTISFNKKGIGTSENEINMAIRDAAREYGASIIRIKHRDILGKSKMKIKCKKNDRIAIFMCFVEYAENLVTNTEIR